MQQQISFTDNEHNPRILREYDPSNPSILGLFEGMAKIPDDFKEPLEDMKEYMY